jgi:hypothetical protein
VLYVTYTDSNSTVVEVWHIDTPASANTIYSPVTYGVVPPDAQASAAAIPLVSGRVYSVTVYGWDAGRGQIEFIGIEGFIH